MKKDSFMSHLKLDWIQKVAFREQHTLLNDIKNQHKKPGKNNIVYHKFYRELCVCLPSSQVGDFQRNPFLVGIWQLCPYLGNPLMDAFVLAKRALSWRGRG